MDKFYLASMRVDPLVGAIVDSKRGYKSQTQLALEAQEENDVREYDAINRTAAKVFDYIMDDAWLGGKFDGR